MKQLFVPYELALIAKEKGFKDFTLAAFDDDKNLEQHRYMGYVNDSLMKHVSAPIYQQLVDWFELKEIYVDVLRYEGGFTTWVMKGEENKYCDTGEIFEKRTEALNKALEEAFKLI